MAAEIYLGKSGNLYLLPVFGRTLKMGDIELSRVDRAASGRKRRDIIATKKKISLSFIALSSEELQLIRDIYNLQKDLTNLEIEIEKDGSTETYTVLMDPIDEERISCINGSLWGPVTVQLEEV